MKKNIKGRNVNFSMKSLRKVGAITAVGVLTAGTTFALTFDAWKAELPQKAVNYKIVVGERAAAADVIGAVELAAALQQVAKVEKTVNVTPEYVILKKKVIAGQGIYPLYKDTAKLYLGNNIASIVPRIEWGKGTFVDRNNNKYDYEMYIVPNKNVSILYADRPDTDAVDPTVLLWNNTQKQPLYTIEVRFTGQLNSTTVVAKPIQLFGKTYYFHKDTDFANGKWVLVEAAKDVVLGVGESVDFEGHTVKLVDVVEKEGGKYAAIVSVDGVSKTIDVGATDTVNGVDIYVVDAYVSKTQAGKAYAELVIGGKKIELSQSTGYVKVGDQELRNVRVVKANANELILQVYKNYDDNTKNYVKAGEEFVDPLFETFKLVFAGPANISYEKVYLTPVSATLYQLRVTDFRGNEKSIDLIKYNGTNVTLIDNKFKGTITGSGSGSVTLKTDEYVVLENPQYKESYLLRLVEIDATNNKAVFEDVFTGSRVEVYNGGNLVVGSFDIPVTVTANNVTLNNVAVQPNSFLWWTKNEAFLNVTLVNNTAQVALCYNAVGVGKSDCFSFTIYYDGNNKRLDVNDTAFATDTVVTDLNKLIYDPDNHVYYGLGDAGVKVKIENADQQDRVEIEVPKEAVYYDVRFEKVGAKVTYETEKVKVGQEIDDTGYIVSGVEGETRVKTVELKPLPVGQIGLLDSEVPSPWYQGDYEGLIVVGGPCVNRVAAELLNKTFPACGVASGIPQNAALVKIVEEGGKVAVLVAGWEWQDTRKAARMLAEYIAEGKNAEVFDGKEEVTIPR